MKNKLLMMCFTISNKPLALKNSSSAKPKYLTPLVPSRPAKKLIKAAFLNNSELKPMLPSSTSNSKNHAHSSSPSKTTEDVNNNFTNITLINSKTSNKPLKKSSSRSKSYSLVKVTSFKLLNPQTK